MRFTISLCLAALLLLPTGCSSLNQIHAQAEGPAAYGGVRHMLARWNHVDTTPGDQMAMVFDLPFSVAFDTLFLPFSGINEIVENGIVVTDARPATERGAIASNRDGRRR